MEELFKQISNQANTQTSKQANKQSHITFFRAPLSQQPQQCEPHPQLQGWANKKGTRNGYIMLASLFGEPRPLILQLDYRAHRVGGLTYRQLHHQVRETLALEKKVSLRMCSFRPWYRYITQGLPLPEDCALPAKDIQEICLERLCCMPHMSTVCMYV